MKMKFQSKRRMKFVVTYQRTYHDLALLFFGIELNSDLLNERSPTKNNDLNYRNYVFESE